MIALINLPRAAAIVGTESFPELPKPPALLWSAFLVGVNGSVKLTQVVAWALQMREARPHVPIGVASTLRRDEHQMLDALARVGLRFSAVLDSRHLAGAALSGAVHTLRNASVESAILKSWLTRWQPSARQLEAILVQIIAHGVRGGKAKSLRTVDATDRTLSESTLRRRLLKAGLPGPGQLLRDARLRGARLRESRSFSANDASVAAGFSSQRERRRAEQRKLESRHWSVNEEVTPRLK